MNDWADHTAGRIRQRRQNQQLKDAKFVEQQRIKRAKGEPLWREVIQNVKENGEALNKRLGEEVMAFEDCPDFEIRVQGRLDEAPRTLIAKFNAENGSLTWRCGDKHEELEISVKEDGSAGFVWGMGIPSTPASIAHQMLNALLGFQ